MKTSSAVKMIVAGIDQVIARLGDVQCPECGSIDLGGDQVALQAFSAQLKEIARDLEQAEKQVQEVSDAFPRQNFGYQGEKS